MKLFGEHAPGEQQDGYLPGAWDQVRTAYMDGHISEDAYDVLQRLMTEVRRLSLPSDIPPDLPEPPVGSVPEPEVGAKPTHKVTIRGEGTELRGHATWAAVVALADDRTDPYVVVASPLPPGECLHADVTGLCLRCGAVPVEGVR